MLPISFFTVFLLFSFGLATQEPTPSTTPTPSPSDTPTPTPTPSHTPTPTPSTTPTPTPTPHPVPAPVPSPTPSPPPTPNFTLPASAFQIFPSPTQPIPQRRSRAVFALSDNNQSFVVIGGDRQDSQNVWTYNIRNQSWFETFQLLPNMVTINGSCYVTSGSGVLIYGGSQDVLLRYDLLNNTFGTLTATNGSEVPTESVSCAVAGGHFYVFGGAMTGGCNSDLFALDLMKMMWHKVDIAKGSAKPEGTTGATLVAYQDSLFLYGGSCDGEDTGVWHFNISSSEWTQSVPKDAPEQRAHHVAYLDVQVPETPAMTIFGGKTQKSMMVMDDIWSYYFLTNSWMQHHPEGEAPSGRYNAGVAAGRGRMIIFGGLDKDHKEQGDLWQFVNEMNCLNATCYTCVAREGCGWCDDNPAGFQCVAGITNIYINGTCNSTSFSNDLLLCPEDLFPGWAVALIIAGVVAAIGILWYLVMRNQSNSAREGYTTVQDH